MQATSQQVAWIEGHDAGRADAESAFHSDYPKARPAWNRDRGQRVPKEIDQRRQFLTGYATALLDVAREVKANGDNISRVQWDNVHPAQSAEPGSLAAVADELDTIGRAIFAGQGITANVRKLLDLAATLRSQAAVLQPKP